jgi:hypothetical protein
MSINNFEKIYNFYILHKKEIKSEKTIDIVIKTSKQENHLLQYNLKFIDKNLSGYRKILILTSDHDHLVSNKDLDIEVVHSPKINFDFGGKGKNKFLKTKHTEDYQSFIQNQVDKLNWHKHTDADDVFFVDVNCFFIKPTNIFDKYFIQNKRVIQKSTQLESYKKSSEDFCKQSSEFYYDAKNFVLNRSVTKEFISFFEEKHGLSMEDYFFDTNKDLPYFINFLGNFIEKFSKNKDKYIFVEDFDSSNVLEVPKSVSAGFCKEQLEKLL